MFSASSFPYGNTVGEVLRILAGEAPATIAYIFEAWTPNTPISSLTGYKLPPLDLMIYPLNMRPPLLLIGGDYCY